MFVSNKNLARWYRETSQHLAAGFPLARAWRTAGGVPRRDRARMEKELLAGEPIETVLSGAPRWMPEVDRHVLSAAAQSGQLVETLLVLSSQRAAAGRQASRAATATIYPLFLVHFAALAIPLRVWFSENFEAYLNEVLPILLPLWVIIAIIVWAAMRRHRWLDFVMRLMPLLRGYTKNRNFANLTFALSAYLVAGETVGVAWEGAGKAADDRRLRKFSENVAQQARLGVSPGEVLNKRRVMPEEFVSLYQTGEETGQLVENLKYLWDLYSERATAKLQAASFWYMKLLFLLVAIGIAYVVIREYMAHFEGVFEMLE
ncbi:MAG TPA: type II secretion system F family protein [Opitutales bacterium]|nr:type II secretion system F family protein [Opitutales bacterium]